MTPAEWEAFSRFREGLKERSRQWLDQFSQLAGLQEAAAAQDTPPYPIETPVVYNSDFDRMGSDSCIKLILTGDNPGKQEQRAENRRYLVGQSGKIAEGFFARNKELGIDFRAHTLILNKTPVHTAKTHHLRFLASQDGEVSALIRQSQIWMAEETARLHQVFFTESGASLWITGYAELKDRGIFAAYRDALRNAYMEESSFSPSWNTVFVFRHFSMNSFLIELNKYTASEQAAGMSLSQRLETIGCAHRAAIFGA